MHKFISEIVQPNEVGTRLTSLCAEMTETSDMRIYDWKAIPYWASDQKHDVILIVLEFCD